MWHNKRGTHIQDLQKAAETQQQQNKTTLWLNGQRKSADIFQRKKLKWLIEIWKKCSDSLPVREMQIKTTLRLYLTPVRMVSIQKWTNTCWWRCVGKVTLIHCGENANQSHHGSQYGEYLDNWKSVCHPTQPSHSLEYTHMRKYLRLRQRPATVFIAAQFK